MHIHIVTAASEKVSRNFILGVLADVWLEQGHAVTTGPLADMDADVAIMHINATLVPESAVPRNPAGRPIINAGILDISKRRIGGRALGSVSAHAGPVIVKTDANHYGKPELKKLPYWHHACLRKKLASFIPWTLARALPHGHYPILAKSSDVPRWVWRSPDLVVEPFMPEMENGEYVVRVWIFFGRQEYCVKLYGPDPIVKSSNSTHFEFIDEVPESVRTKRAELGIDFGKIDFTIVDGEAVVFDVNKTPSVRTGIPPSAKMLGLADGLDYFLLRNIGAK